MVHLRMEVAFFALYSVKLRPDDANFRFVNGPCHHWLKTFSEWTFPYLLKFSPRQNRNWL